MRKAKAQCVQRCSDRRVELPVVALVVASLLAIGTPAALSGCSDRENGSEGTEAAGLSVSDAGLKKRFTKTPEP